MDPFIAILFLVVGVVIVSIIALYVQQRKLKQENDGREKLQDYTFGTGIHSVDQSAIQSTMAGSDPSIMALGLALAVYEDQGSTSNNDNDNLTVTPVNEDWQGDGGQFNGGGASGSWEDSSSASPASSPEDSSSSNDSSYDSSSSDSGSYDSGSSSDSSSSGFGD